MKKSIFSITAISIALAALANAGTVNFTNTSGASGLLQIQVNGVPIPAGSGFVAVGTTPLTPADLAGEVNASGHLSVVGRDTLAASFTVFGNAGTFGVNGLDGYFSGSSQVNGAAYDNNWVGQQLVLVIGNGTGIADSGHLAIIDGGDFGADNPLFSTNIGTGGTGTLLFGTASGTSSLGAQFGAVQLGEVVPEPGVAILALLSAGIIFLRRRR